MATRGLSLTGSGPMKRKAKFPTDSSALTFNLGLGLTFDLSYIIAARAESRAKHAWLWAGAILGSAGILIYASLGPTQCPDPLLI